MEMMNTQEILRKFRSYKLTRGKIFYIEKFGDITKIQRVENGRVKNYYNPKELEKALNRPRRKRSKPLERNVIK